MNRFSEIKAKNPQLPMYEVTDDAFLRYGRVIDIDTTEMCELVRANAVYPESGCSYVTKFDPIDNCKAADEYRALLCGQLDEQWGLCWGYNEKMEALEWHTCNEFNIGVTDLVLLLAKRSDIGKDGRLDASKVVAFYLPEGKMIEVYSDTLHYAPCEIDEKGFACVVGLQRGTNEDVDASMAKDKLVTAKNKWLLAHDDNQALIDSGAVAGVYGENWTVNTL